MGVDDVMALRLPSTSEVRMTMNCEGNGPEVGSPMPTIPLVGLGPDAHASWGPSARATLLATGMVTLTMPGDGMRMPLASRPTSDACGRMNQTAIIFPESSDMQGLHLRRALADAPGTGLQE